MSAYHRVNLALGGHLGQILAKAVEHRGGGFAALFPLFHPCAAVVIFVVIVAHHLMRGGSRFGKMELMTQLVFKGLEVETRLSQHHLDGVLAVELSRFQNGQHQVVRFYHIASVLL